MMLSRQKQILYMLRRLGGSTSRLQFVKLCFLLRQTAVSFADTPFYDFLPYKHGPYSFALYHEMGKLAEQGLVRAPDDKHWVLTNEKAGKSEQVEGPYAAAIDSVIDTYGGLNVNELIDHVYARYPWYTVNAKAISKRREIRPISEPMVYTTGYQGQNIDHFLDFVMRSGVRQIIDIRNNPTARRYGFHGSRIRRLTEFLDLSYMHIAELGIESRHRRTLGTPESYRKLFLEYKKRISSMNVNDIQQSCDAMNETPSVLLCAESDPLRCHRSILADEISSRTGLKTVHLDPARC